MRSKTIPADAEVIRTYDGLREFRDSFFNGEFYFLLLVGRHGLSKSWEFEARCKPHKDRGGNEVCVAHYLKGNITPVEAYRAAYTTATNYWSLTMPSGSGPTAPAATCSGILPNASPKKRSTGRLKTGLSNEKAFRSCLRPVLEFASS